MLQLVIIRGYCGVGKSTVTKELAKRLKFALLDYDIFIWSFNAYPKHTKQDYISIGNSIVRLMKL